MRRTNKFLSSLVLGLFVSTALVAPGFGAPLLLAQASPPTPPATPPQTPPTPPKPPAPPAADAVAGEIDFGDDTSEWAKDGECDDPRFSGTGSATELNDVDVLKDATDCKAAFEAGTVALSETEEAEDEDLGGAVQIATDAEIDFGDDTGQWAKDGECDDPRFAGTGSATELEAADLMKDATDCKAAFEAGTIALVEDGGTSPADIEIASPIDAIDFGDDSSEWAKDGECDDPRFTGTGSAVELVDADILKDATDCKAAYAAGTVTLDPAGGTATPVTVTPSISYGDDTSEYANDGECDDPRFTGTGVAETLLDEDLMHDATDCREAVEAGTARLADDADATGNVAFDYGADLSKWANDGECDDPRFVGAGASKKLLADDIFADATDCKTLEAEGQVTVRAVYTPEYAAGAPYDSSDIDFGNNTSDYADDDQCDDPRFEGPGAAATMLDEDLLHDRNDCQELFESGQVVLIES